MKLTYIYHSGFLIETPEYSIIIDYYKDSENNQTGKISNLLRLNKKLYVLCTHSHHDHYNDEILNWEKDNNQISYIFSKEILDENLPHPHKAIFLDKFDIFEDQHIKVKAFGSTDTGGSFLIQCSDKTIFHAGDLNNWHWKEEVDAKEANEYEANFLHELDLLKQYTNKIDLVMFPVDPRLGKEYMLGAQQFADAIEIGLFCPMHFGEQYSKANAMKAYIENKGAKFFNIQSKGDSIIF